MGSTGAWEQSDLTSPAPWDTDAGTGAPPMNVLPRLTLKQMMTILDWKSASSVLQIVLGILIVVTNSFGLHSLRRRRFVKGRPTNIYMYSMCVGDLIIGLAAIDTGLLNRVFRLYTSADLSCRAAASLQYVGYAGALVGMMGAAIDQSVAVVYPAAHGRRLKSKLHKAVAIVAWIVIWLGFLSLVRTGTEWTPGKDCYMMTVVVSRVGLAVFVFPAILLPIITAIIALILLFIRSQRHSVVAAEIGIGNGSGSPQASVSEATDENAVSVFEPRYVKKTKRRTALVACVLLLTLACWSPIIVQTGIGIAKGSSSVDPVLWTVWYEICLILVLLKSLIMPILFQRFSPDITPARLFVKLCSWGDADDGNIPLNPVVPQVQPAPAQQQ